MGIPSFFREILEKYRKTHFWDPNFKVDMLFLDYNAMIYPAVREYFKRVSYEAFQKMTTSRRENAIVSHVVEFTLNLVNQTIRPQKLLYIAVDGSAPRSKMKLQRERRYHRLKEEAYISQLRETFEIKDPSTLWNTTSISPGTSFMSKLSSELWKNINNKKFMDGNITVVLSDANRPGEGEHKIIPFIRRLKSTEDVLVVYSQDADLIVLSMAIPQPNLYILRDKDTHSKTEMEIYPDTDHLYLSMSKYLEALKNDYGLTTKNPVNVSYDILFLSFFGGNDFIKPIPFLRINKGGWKVISHTYRRISEKYNNSSHPYLVEFHNVNDKVIPVVNSDMFEDLLKEFDRLEDRKMKDYYQRILSIMNRRSGDEAVDFDEKLANFQHKAYYSVDNPFPQFEEFKKINYSLPHNQWKDQYYSYFFGISPENPREFRQYKMMVCQMWLKSLSYTLRYYLTGIPSWHWYYPFRVAPMPSDILFFLKTVPKNLNFNFDQNIPYTPFEQLSYILPQQDTNLLPKNTRALIKNPKSPLAPFYPIDFQLDVLVGEKFIYAHPILPPIVDEIALPALRATFTKLTKV